MEFKLVDCAICGCDDTVLLLQSKDYRYGLSNHVFKLVQCKKCGLIYLNPRPNENQLADFYPDDGYYRQETWLRFYLNFIRSLKIRDLENSHSKGLILDVGCGDASFLQALQSRGWQVHGTDVSKKAYNLAKQKIKNIYLGNIEDCSFEEKKFDVVTLNHVLEHLADPAKDLKIINRILKDDGLLWLSLPNINSKQFDLLEDAWHHLELPRHIYQYSPKSIDKILQRNGFEIVRINYPLLDFPFEIIHSLKTKWQLKSLKISDVFFTNPLLRLLPSWRGTMAVFAKKK